MDTFASLFDIFVIDEADTLSAGQTSHHSDSVMDDLPRDEERIGSGKAVAFCTIALPVS
ncbi:hypothetical protein D9615_007164 [Tricholomella constricta]|uniref:Uncharacterized protein n=1 Tax=Tricholomella constricta TaxID=117010 RepID=A0A8H5H8I3_9AGAR|nr:hypothetical protein D9615_007164 [Tricholomella constricta]